MQARWSGTGLTLGLVSAATFGTSGPMASALITAGWSPAAVVGIRVALAALVLTVPALVQLRGIWHAVRRGAGQVLLTGAVAVAGCQFAYFNAVQHLSVGVALLLEYLGSVLVVAWLWLRHGERPRRLTVAGAAAAVVGLLLVLNLTGSQHLDVVGVLWALVAAVGLATFFVVTASSDGGLPPVPMTWLSMVVGAAVLLVVGAIGLAPLRIGAADVRMLNGDVTWLFPILWLALISAAVAYVTGIRAVRFLGAKLGSFLGLTEVLFAVLFAWLMLGQLPGALQLLGGVFIVVGVALVRLDELRTPRRRVSPERVREPGLELEGAAA